MIIAIAIFVIAYGFIASEKFPRHWVALVGGTAAPLLTFRIYSTRIS